MHRISRSLVFVCLAVCGLLVPWGPPRADDAIARGRAFLENAQLNQGTLTGAAIIDWSEGAEALEASPALDLLRLQLSMSMPENRQASLLRLASLAGTPFANGELVAPDLAALERGELGLPRGATGPDPLVTAAALRACARQGCAASTTGTLLLTLAALQRPDGSFGFADEDGDVAVTAEVARGLRSSGVANAQPLLAAAVAWLRAHAVDAPLAAADQAQVLIAVADADPGLAAALVADLLASQDASGGFDGGDIRATALAILALHAGLPDLRVALAPLQEDATAGLAARCKLYVSNVGRTASPATTVQAAVTDPSGTVLFTSAAAVPALSPGVTSTVLVDLGVQGASGARVATFTVNPALAFPESSYKNNQLSSSYTIKSLPELVVDPADISATPSPVELRVSTRIAVRVRNVGGAAAQNVHVQLFDGQPEAGGTLVGETFFNAVAANMPRVLNVSWTPRDLQPHTLVARVDPEAAVPQATRARNQASITLMARNPADFVVDLYATLGGGLPSAVNQGDPVTINMSLGGLIKRFGVPYPDPAQWPFHTVDLVLYQGTPGVLGAPVWRYPVPITRCTNGIDVYTVCSVDYPYPYQYKVPTQFLSGAIQYTLVLDPDNLTQDVNRSNNSLVLQLQVNNPGLAELWIDPSTIRSDPNLVPTTRPATLHASVMNSGLAVANNVRVDLVLPARTVTTVIPALAPGQPYDAQFVITGADLQLGNNGTIVVDPLNTIQESSKANNTAPISLTRSDADFTVTITTEPYPAPADQNVDLVVTLKNDGTNGASPQSLNVYIQGQPQTWYVADGSTIPAGQSKVYRHTFSTAGLRRSIQASVNAGAIQKAVTLPILNADLALPPEGISFESAGGQLVTPVVTVNNLGNLTVTTSVRVYRGYPEQGDRASEGTVTVPAAGSAVWRGPAFVPAAALPSVATVVVDQENALTELDESNNFATATTKARSSKVVAFDETHLPAGSVGTNEVAGIGGSVAGLSVFASDLEARGYHVITLDPDGDGLTPNKLQADVVVIDTPIQPYTSPELQLLRTFVEARGGSVFVLGDWGGSDPGANYQVTNIWEPIEDQLTLALGFKAVHLFVYPGGPCSAYSQVFSKQDGTLRLHPITSGVDRVFAQYVGGFKDLPAGAEVTIQSASNWATPNVVVGGVFPLGAGRVGFHGDGNLMDADFSGPGGSPYCPAMFDIYRQNDNRRYAMQMIDWLVGGGPRDWLPDLVFSPATLTLDRSTVTAGDVVTITGSVRNVGGALPSGLAAVMRLYDGPATTGTLIGEIPLTQLTADEAQGFSFTWNTRGLTGAHTLTGVIDPDGLVTEVSRDNNVVSLAVPVRGAADLRIDPIDVGFPSAGGVSVKVHNLGYAATVAGAAQLVLTDDAGQVLSASLGSVPARGALSVTLPWSAKDKTVTQVLHITADPQQVLDDCDRTNQTAQVTVTPPAIALYAPTDGMVIGGTKTFRWSFASDEFPDATVGLAIGPVDGTLKAVGVANPTPARPDIAVDIDTTKYANGLYKAQVTADAKLVKGVREVVFRIDNSGSAQRAFSTGQVTTGPLAQPGATAQIVLPAGVHVDSATALLDVQLDPSATIPGANGSEPVATWPSFDRRTIFAASDRLVTVYAAAGTNELMAAVSLDGGATWSTPNKAGVAGVSAWNARGYANANGLHVFYVNGSTLYYTRSTDGGLTWQPRSLGPAPYEGFGVEVADDGITIAGSWYANGSTPIGLFRSPPDGSRFTMTKVPVFTQSYGWLQVLSAGGRVRVFHILPNVGVEYAEASTSGDLSLASSWSTPLTLTPAANQVHAYTANGHLDLVYTAQVFSNGYYYPVAYLQRCELVRDCSRLDRWLQSSVQASGLNVQGLAQRDPQGLQVVVGTTVNSTGPVAAFGMHVDRGARLGHFVELDLSPIYWFSGGDSLLAIQYNSPITVTRWPGFGPSQTTVDFGSDGRFEWADGGPSAKPAAVPDFATSLNAYLTAHAGDASNGQISVPVALGLRGAGKVVLRNLEIRYRPLSAIAALAEPALISPQTSPGILDTSTLSVTTASPIQLIDSAGRAVRSLATAPSGTRYAAGFDGRDDAGAYLASGSYSFGAAPATASIELDNLPPTADLAVDSGGAYGGRAPIFGTATDTDYAGSPKNFAYYVLEYTLDGCTYQPIATSTVAVSNGALGIWDTRRLASQPATLRLTVVDRAGNATTTVRTVNVSPNAPQAPVISAPSLAGTPIDALSPVVEVRGAAEAGTTVTVYVNGVAVGSVPSDGQWSLAGVALPQGVASITAVAARNGQNSPSARPIQVARYALQVAVSAPFEAPARASFDALVTLQRVSVTRTPLTVRVSMTTLAGVPAGVPLDTTVTPDSTGYVSFPVTLDTRALPPGPFVVQAEVVEGGRVPASASTAVTLTEPEAVLASLASDRAVYDALQLVAFSGRVLNNAIDATSALQATITLIGPDGHESTLATQDLAPIPGVQYVDLSALDFFTPHAVGPYTATLTVTGSAGKVLATARTSYEVGPAAGSDALAGTLVVNPTTYVPGDAVTAQFTVTNRGDEATVPVSLLVLSRATTAIVNRVDFQLPLAGGATVSGSRDLSTANADGRELAVVLVGRGRALAGQAVAPSPVRDLTPPSIVIAGFSDGEYRAGDVTPVITVTDQSPFTALTELSGKPFASNTTVHADGEYSLVVTAMDAYGNRAQSVEGFTIDTVPPHVALSGVEDGELSSAAALSPVATATDLHLDLLDLTLDGAPFASGMDVVGEGDHVLVATARDRAGNTASVQAVFTLDRTPPAITVGGVTEGQVTSGPVIPLVEVTDLHPGDLPTVLLDGLSWVPGPITADGEHVLSVQAADLAGNVGTASVRFIIDTTAPRISISGVPTDPTNADVVPVVTVVDPHLVSQTVRLDGLPFESGTRVTAEGDHLLSVEAVDEAGNSSSAAAHFTIDRTPPQIAISGVSDGQVTRTAVTPVIGVSDRSGARYTATLDGAPFSSGGSVSAEGTHVLLVHATDTAGNLAEGRVQFAIDRTPPVVTLVGVAQGGTYPGSAAATWTVDDPQASITALLDGQPYVAGTAIVASGSHTLSVTAVDKAGNRGSAQASFTILSTSFVLQGTVDRSASVLVALPCANKSCSASPASVLLGWLDGAGIRYDVALGDADLIRQLRSLRHNVVVLYKSASTERGWTDELLERVHAGTGLVVVNTPPPDNDPKLKQAIGLTFKGKIKSVGTVSFSASPLGPAFTTSVSGSGVVESLQTATAVGRASGDTVLALATYGGGRTVTFTFDPEVNNGNADLRDLVLRIVRHGAGGASLDPVPHEPVRVAFTASQTSGASVQARLELTIPAGLSVLAAPGSTGTAPVSWSFTLPAGGTESRTATVAAGAPGNYVVNGALGISESGRMTSVASASVPVTVGTSGSDVLAAAVAAVTALPSSAGKTDALAQLGLVTLTPATTAEAEGAIGHVLAAVADVAGSSAAEAPAARSALDQLLRATELAANTVQ